MCVFPILPELLGPNTRSTFCVYFCLAWDYPQATVAGPIALGRGPHVGDGKDGVVVCMLELVVRVRLLWVEYLGIKQNQGCCIISCGYFMSEIYVRSNLIWVDYLGVGWWTGSRIRTRFFIISWSIMCLDLRQSHFDLGKLSWNGVANGWLDQNKVYAS